MTNYSIACIVNELSDDDFYEMMMELAGIQNIDEIDDFTDWLNRSLREIKEKLNDSEDDNCNAGSERLNETLCMNGVLKVGDTVLSTPCSDYPCLIGVVTAIDPVGTPEHNSTDNDTDDVHVDFYNDYSKRRQKEILETIRDLYDDRSKSYDDICWEIIMAPDELLRLDDSEKNNKRLLRNILDREVSASALAFIELSKENRKLKRKIDIEKI